MFSSAIWHVAMCAVRAAAPTSVSAQWHDFLARHYAADLPVHVQHIGGRVVVAAAGL